ncbi:MAG: pepT [Clostridiales bacterium]|jgi:tripeptide aminopeptidase|nr:pepT [Clostridiales bacterium]
MKAYERLLKYVKVYTTSDDDSQTHPTTMRQFDLAHLLVEEMKELGLQDVRVDDKCYVYGYIPATEGYEDKASIGLIAHMDTSPDACGENVNPQIIEDYDGKDITLKGSGDVISIKKFPHLLGLKGRTLITSDGTTLLGADDKSGIAEIMTVCERILSENIPHGKICIGFTPDEEVGQGADFFDVENFGADFAYTVDGSAEGEIEYENFYAADATFEIKGLSVHPGYSKDTMINALLVAFEINGMLPSGETPRDTESYEGFYHLSDFAGEISSAKMKYIIRDHDETLFEAKKATLKHIEKLINIKYGEGTVKLTIEDSYKNMIEQIKPCFHLVENAKQAIEKLGITPITTPIRGGTDGARLSYMGLPCPNLGTGGYAYHGQYEHISVEGMDTCVQIVLEILNIYANTNVDLK